MSPQIEKALSRLEWAIRRSRALRAAFVSAAAVAAVGLIVAVGLFWFGVQVPMWLIPTLAAGVFVVAAMAAGIRKMDRQTLCLWVDRRLDLDERLSTLSRMDDTANPFYQALVRETEARLGSVDAGRWVRSRISVSAMTLGVALVLTLGIQLLPGTRAQSTATDFDLLLGENADRLSRRVSRLEEMNPDSALTKAWIRQLAEQIEQLDPEARDEFLRTLEAVDRNVEARMDMASASGDDATFRNELQKLYREIQQARHAAESSGAAGKAGASLEEGFARNFTKPQKMDGDGRRVTGGVAETGSEVETNIDAPETGAASEIPLDAWTYSDRGVKQFPAEYRPILKKYFSQLRGEAHSANEGGR